MPKFLEEKLKKEYPNEPSAPYKIMNKLGVMHGNKETAKGKAEEKKHVEDKKKEIAGRMKHKVPTWEEFGKTGKAIGKSVKRHVKKEHLAF